MSPRMRTTWDVLERAKDAEDQFVIDACRRMIEADRVGRFDQDAWRIIKEFAAED